MHTTLITKSKIDLPLKKLPTMVDFNAISTTPLPSTIYKDDCMYCFDTVKLSDGLNVCFTCYQSFCPEHAKFHHQHTSHGVYLNVTKTLKERADEPKRIKLEVKDVSEDETFDTHTRVVEVSDTISEVSYPSEFEQQIAKVLSSKSESYKQEVAAWSLDIQPCEHTIDFVQNPCENIDLTHCSSCDLTGNLWICLTCGALGCGRQQVGIEGHSHALAHYNETKHPIAVKLGSLSKDEADVYCYACDDEIRFPDMSLSAFGINIDSLEKTEKTLVELQIEQNIQWDFNMKDSDGNEFQSFFGPGFTGMKNLGNSCYLNSVVQMLWSLYSYRSAFDKEIENVAQPALDLTTQLKKLSKGLLTGKYAGEDRGIKPESFKTLIGQGNEEFQSHRQQDAMEFLVYLISKIDSLPGNPNDIFKFKLENKFKCFECGKVKLTEEISEHLASLPVELVTEGEGYAKQKFMDSFDSFCEPEPMSDYKCPSCDAEAVIKTVGFQTFPPVLLVNPSRIRLENWTPVKTSVELELPGDEMDLSKYKAEGLVEGEELITEKFTPNADYVTIIQEMGFSENAAIRALYNTGNQDPEAATNWLFAHMEDADINAPLVLDDKPANDVDSEALSMLVSMGLSEKLCRKALVLHKNDANAATEWVFNNMDDDGELPAAAAPAQISNGSPRYKLKAVICHKGNSVHSGHYVSFIKKDSDWVLFNDEKVVIANDSKNIQEIWQNGYIYMFVQEGSCEDQ